MKAGTLYKFSFSRHNLVLSTRTFLVSIRKPHTHANTSASHHHHPKQQPPGNSPYFSRNGPIKSHYRRSTPPISVPLNKLFSGTFPLSLKESIEDFKVKDDLFQFQHNLLKVLPFYPEMDSLGRSSEVIKTYIDEKNYINEFVIYPNEETKANYDQANHLIMIHGYGSGLGLYIKNYNDIPMDNWIVHSIDLLGYGCSSRPEFTPNTFDKVEAWFHDSFQKWAELRQIPKSNTTVLAHSMGAYLMTSYGMKVDPDFCKKLIMVSPGAVINHKLEISIPGYFGRLWEKNISPFSLVRNASFYGSKLVSGWTYRRYSNLSKDEQNLLHKYTYGIFQAPGSGEYMLNFLLKPGANPRVPLIERAYDVCNFKFRWWYGKDDWMNSTGGQICTEKLLQKGKDSKVVEIDNSGHHIYLDNYKKFNQLLIEEMIELSN